MKSLMEIGPHVFEKSERQTQTDAAALYIYIYRRPSERSTSTDLVVVTGLDHAVLDRPRLDSVDQIDDDNTSGDDRVAEAGDFTLLASRRPLSSHTILEIFTRIRLLRARSVNPGTPRTGAP